MDYYSLFICYKISRYPLITDSLTQRISPFKNIILMKPRAACNRKRIFFCSHMSFKYPWTHLQSLFETFNDPLASNTYLTLCYYWWNARKYDPTPMFGVKNSKTKMRWIKKIIRKKKSKTKISSVIGINS